MILFVSPGLKNVINGKKDWLILLFFCDKKMIIGNVFNIINLIYF